MVVEIRIIDDTLTPGLTRALDGLTDTSELMGDLAQFMFEVTKDNFRTERGPDGSVWAPRSPATLEKYRRDGSPFGRLLSKEGGLQDSLGVDWGNGFAEVGVNQPYAAVMQLGARQGAFGRTKRNGPIPWGNIPARPYLGLGAEHEKDVLDIINEWLERQFDG